MNRVGFWVVRSLPWIVVSSLMGIGACSSDAPQMNPNQPQSCQAPLTNCGAGCVDPTSDGLNCGACGAMCPMGQFCSMGMCATSCPPGAAVCGSGCVDVLNNPLHCGNCNVPCPNGAACVNGMCSGGTSCPPGQLSCNGMCTDVAYNPAHCGNCGIACPSGICQGGICAGGGSGGTGGFPPVTGGTPPTTGGASGGLLPPTGGIAGTGGVGPTGGGSPLGGGGSGGSGATGTGATQGTGGDTTLLGGYHVHGDWSGFAFAFATNDATISPDNFEDMVDQDGPYCVSGTVNNSEEYVNIAAFGVNVSQPKIEDAPVNTVTTTGTGLLIDIQINAPETVRIQLEGPNGAEDASQRWCTNITGTQNTVIPWDSFVLECWSGGDETPFNPTANELAKVIVYVPDSGPTGSPQTFDFCVNDIGPDNVTGRGTGQIVASCGNNVSWDGPTSTSDQYINVPTAGNAYQFQSNGWGWQGGGHSISLLGSCGFKMDSQTCSRSDYSPCSFPSIYVGTDADGTRTSGFAAQPISAIGAIPTCLGWSSGGTPASDEYNVSYDVWFNSNAGANYAETFLMVWFRSPPNFPPAGSPMQDGVVIGDQTWTVWYGPNADGQNVVSYEAPNARANGQAYDFNLKDFIDDAVERGYLNQSLNLIAVMGGMEIWNGAQGASITDFRAEVQ